MKAKKVLALVMSTVLAFGLAACGRGRSPSGRGACSVLGCEDRLVCACTSSLF